MSKYSSIADLFTAICDAVRKKESSTELINHTDLPERIENLNTGGESLFVELETFSEEFVELTTVSADDIIVYGELVPTLTSATSSSSVTI